MFTRLSEMATDATFPPEWSGLARSFGMGGSRRECGQRNEHTSTPSKKPQSRLVPGGRYNFKEEANAKFCSLDCNGHHAVRANTSNSCRTGECLCCHEECTRYSARRLSAAGESNASGQSNHPTQKLFEGLHDRSWVLRGHQLKSFGQKVDCQLAARVRPGPSRVQ